ncbi:phosphoribosylformylglycinamidine synthase subunit PurL [Salinicoccus halodurans]|uniref:Phosphoribosylformylglycinamidine synthase subunit PurL n=1 Tax=Salinicoccus halodurans TaxID=407035 RepID=A0A0F7HL77_9STAP|nr:phosphoribosylformylglycinamidine synthase subunit PurL [Salinicoccus halodurans]AKG73632.1 phosphoribosylformylglycinamidine synthase [Salinicoccus halodurans]SFK53629.1 phosphoribosylformylglycinamidine synthase subunit II [Salinicoccus halodurans]
MSRFIEPTADDIRNQKLYAEMGLTDAEYDKVIDILGRQPNYTEIGIFSVMWSEHCSYKHSKPFLKQFPTSGERVLMGPGEGAGVVDIGDNQAVVFKVESHNHPSAVEPYQGAATGVGGIIRDIVSIGARPIGLLNSLRFGELTEANNRRLLRGVVSGIGGYGNCIGIPTVSGEVEFDPSYDGNPLVNAMCVGVMDQGKVQKGTAKGVGNKVIYVGLKTGRDGIHGATFASEELSDESESKRPSVQIGDPFTGKKLMEATLAAIDQPELVGIQDMGAAGLTSSSSEMAAKGEAGMNLYLDQVPVREEGISPYEMMLSETQERMLLVVEDGTEQKFLDMFEDFELDAAVIGEVTDSDRLKLYYEEELYADIPVQPLSDEAPVYILEGRKPELDEKAYDYSKKDLNKVFDQLIEHPTHGAKNYIYEQYDNQVGSNTVRKSGFGSGVVRVEGTDKAIAMAIDGKSRYVYADPYNGGKEVVAQVFRSIISTGAVPLAMTDCLNYGSPENPEIYNQLEESTKGMAEACRALETPVVSGNVSLYNENRTASILPTPVIGMVGLIEDVNFMEGISIEAGDAVYLVGETEKSFAGSQIEKLLDNEVSKAVRNIDLELEYSRGMTLRGMLEGGDIKKISPVGRGGIAVKLAQLASFHGLGLDAEIELDGEDLFAENASRYIVTAKPGQDIKDAVEIGRLTEDGFRIKTRDVTIERDLAEVAGAWEGAIPKCMTSVD